jgi:hypothetical protein
VCLPCSPQGKGEEEENVKKPTDNCAGFVKELVKATLNQNTTSGLCVSILCSEAGRGWKQSREKRPSPHNGILSKFEWDGTHTHTHTCSLLARRNK